ncbi:MAG: hypothetical protein SLAVMIC_00278 [uncultured marine phage]|uniref:Uncharacterized protein n=1 Tax=uncultured marine phage TaxID=707152 RepID=A0A8D9C8N1_9VIRU|nr:MAG: hypothetical protein SLAVMIC_00278 [uncultured marine phage]
MTVCKDCLTETNGMNATNDINSFDYLDICPECGSVENTIELTEDQYEFLELSHDKVLITVPVGIGKLN